MKLTAKDSDGLLRAPLKIGAVLIHGADAGQVRQRATQFAEHWLGKDGDPMAKREFSPEEIKEDPALLSDELAAMSLMSPRRVIQLREADDPHLSAVEAALTARAADNFLILYTTEALPATSKLRLFAERSPDVASIALYKDEGAGLEQFIAESLRGYGLRAPTDVLRYLASQLSGDRQIIVNELEKLSLYIGDEAESFTIEDAAAVIGDNSDQSFDALNIAVAGGDMVSLCRLSDKLLLEGNPGLLMVRSLMRYFSRLEIIALKRAEGQSIDAAIEGLRPPVFFKAKPALKSHAQKWTPEACATALARLQMLELDSKRHSDESLTRMAQGFMEIAGLVQLAKRAA